MVSVKIVFNVKIYVLFCSIIKYVQVHLNTIELDYNIYDFAISFDCLSCPATLNFHNLCIYMIYVST